MKHGAASTSFPSITTDGLHLREIRSTDAEALFSLKSDPEVTSSYGREPHRTIGDTRAWLQNVQDSYSRRDGIMWCVTLKNQDLAIGSCCFWNIDEDFHCGELGYELNRAHWGKGIMTEALPAVIAYGFNDLGLHRIEANPLQYNAASTNLLHKLGFTLEGTLRQRCVFRGQYFDQLYFGLLANEWRRVVKGGR
jgi:[ribosomal protein S5]-alanine N-acetyltransferase